MSAKIIIDTAPLGALIGYTDGCPKPPARFAKKLAAWERSNGLGRLVKKELPRPYPTWTAPASFTLHEGNFSSDGVILVTILRSHSADSALVFEVAEEPQARQVRVLLDFGGNTELLHLAESVGAAELWIAKEGYRNARLEIVGSDVIESGARKADMAALGFGKPEGPAAGGSLPQTRPRPAIRGAPKAPSPRTLPPTVSMSEARAVSASAGQFGSPASKYQPPLASPFLGPKPVFEINPRGVGLRASPCRRPDSGPIQELGPERTR